MYFDNFQADSKKKKKKGNYFHPFGENVTFWLLEAYEEVYKLKK